MRRILCRHRWLSWTPTTSLSQWGTGTHLWRGCLRCGRSQRREIV